MRAKIQALSERTAAQKAADEIRLLPTGDGSG